MNYVFCSFQISLRRNMTTPCTQMIWNSSMDLLIPRPGESFSLFKNYFTLLQHCYDGYHFCLCHFLRDLSIPVYCGCRGRMVYQLTLSLWRFLFLCYYTKAWLEVLKLTKHMEDGTIKARWRIRGLPFHSLLLRFYRKDKSNLYR